MIKLKYTHDSSQNEKPVNFTNPSRISQAFRVKSGHEKLRLESNVGQLNDFNIQTMSQVAAMNLVYSHKYMLYINVKYGTTRLFPSEVTQQ